MSDEQEAAKLLKKSAAKPKTGMDEKTAIVRCNNFQCLGIMGSDGVWRDANRRPLEVVEVVTEFQNSPLSSDNQLYRGMDLAYLTCERT